MEICLATDSTPALEMFDVGANKVVIDTRKLACAPMTPLTSAQAAVLLDLDKPTPRRAIAQEKWADVEWLIARDFVINHEDTLLSIVVRARSEVRAQMLSRKVSRLEAAA